MPIKISQTQIKSIIQPISNTFEPNQIFDAHNEKVKPHAQNT